ncbi:hypothetical protein KAI46_08360 [bacterium]|nr:hypothetical protein [bacterium]
MNKKQFLEALENQRDKFIAEPAAPNKHLARNCKEIAEYIGLNNAEQQILLFTVLLKEDRGLQEVANKLVEVNVEAIAIILSTILEFDRQEIRDALSRQGLLS